MRLVELEPEFIRRVVVPNTPTRVIANYEAWQAGREEQRIETVLRDQVQHHVVATLAEAEGIFFLCPVCFKANGGPVGTHGIICWTPKVPPDAQPGPGRWELVGSSFEDLSLRAGSSSIKLTGGCEAHFHVTNGNIE